MEDNIDELVKNQRIIAQLLAQQSGTSIKRIENEVVRNFDVERGDRTVNQQVDRSVNQQIDLTEPNEQNTGDTFSTGTDPIVLTDTDDWELIRFGKVVDVVNIRSTDSVDMAYSPPTNQGSIITLESSDLPFTDGGNQGVGTSFLWIRKSSLASSNPEVRIIAR